MRGYKREVIKTVTILGEKIEIFVNSEGEFSARAGGEGHRADRLADLLPKLRRSAQKRRVKVAVPATVIGVGLYDGGPRFNRKYLGIGCKDVLLTGIDPRTDEVTFRNTDGSVLDKDLYNFHRVHGDLLFCRPMPPEAQQEYTRLYTARQAAKDAMSEFEETWKLNAYAAVKEAINAAVDDPKEDLVEESEDPR